MTQDLALEELPPSVLYDVFQDAAAVLTGLYVERERGAVDASVAADWWAKVLALRDQARAVRRDDRVALAEHVRRWRREAAELSA